MKFFQQIYEVNPDKKNQGTELTWSYTAGKWGSRIGTGAAWLSTLRSHVGQDRLCNWAAQVYSLLAPSSL